MFFKTDENACVLMHVNCQEEELIPQQCDVRELFPGARHVLAASKSLSCHSEILTLFR